ncbi:hypothetical protein LINPERHAP1_LOCUS34933 [Linum perenne]
MEELTEA